MSTLGEVLNLPPVAQSVVVEKGSKGLLNEFIV